MNTIYKFELQEASKQSIKIPKGFRILNLGIQNDNICVWAMVDSESPSELVSFEIYGTGHEIIEDANRRYIGTVIKTYTGLVWHVFVMQ